VTIACVGLGAVLSIVIKSEKNLVRKEHETEDEDDIIDLNGALKFPVYATIALFSLYILFKNIDKDFLNMLFKINFGIMGASCIGSILEEFIPSLFPNLPQKILVDKEINLVVAK